MADGGSVGILKGGPFFLDGLISLGRQGFQPFYKIDEKSAIKIVIWYTHCHKGRRMAGQNMNPILFLTLFFLCILDVRFTLSVQISYY